MNTFTAKDYVKFYNDGKLLNIACCTKAKIWDRGTISQDIKVPAMGAYVGPMYKQFMELVNWTRERNITLPWQILSALHGIISPLTTIEYYNVSFSNKNDRDIVVSNNALKNTFILNRYDKYQVIVVWGGAPYVDRIKSVSSTIKSCVDNKMFIVAPACGLPIGKAIGALKSFREEIMKEFLIDLKNKDSGGHIRC